MKAGTLGTAAVAVDQLVEIYRVPAGCFATVSLMICNATTTDGKVSVAIAPGASPVDGNWIEHDAVISTSRPLERTGVVLGPNTAVFAKATGTVLNVNVLGFEEQIA